MKLSIIVISHNQKKQLKRCIESILSQELPFEHEIIISDDASKDGTWELAQDYANKFGQIKATQCDTNDNNPANNSERSGLNRCNGYRLASGKYIAHIDADDFHLEGRDIYKKQVELLDDHPDCSCCMANDYTLQDGDNISQIDIRHKEVFETGTILPSDIYIKKFFRESHCFVYRRNPEVDPVNLYGGFYVDTLITSHHVQYGDIICLNDASYVYVQYKTSIWAKTKQSQDRYVLSTPIYLPYLIPRWQGVFTQRRGRLLSILKAVKLSLSRYKLGDASGKWIAKFDLYFYGTFSRSLGLADYVRLLTMYGYILLLILWNPQYKWPHKILCKLLY